MKRWTLAVAATVALAGMIAGCIDVKAPSGPYVNLGSGSSAKADPDLKNMRAFLDEAREDGIITKNQCKELKKRLEKKFGD